MEQQQAKMNQLATNTLSQVKLLLLCNVEKKLSEGFAKQRPLVDAFETC